MCLNFFILSLCSHITIIITSAEGAWYHLHPILINHYLLLTDFGEGFREVTKGEIGGNSWSLLRSKNHLNNCSFTVAISTDSQR